MNVSPVKKEGPILIQTQFDDTKDPCPVFDGGQWHIFGSGGSVRGETWKVLHATAPSPKGPWTEQASVVLIGVEGHHVAAPGVVFDFTEKAFHMFIQTDFLALRGTIEHLASCDGATFKRKDSALLSVPASGEAGLYDSHPAIVNGVKYLVYSGVPHVDTAVAFSIMPDLYLAKSITNTWYGPWERLGKILGHDEIREHHNQIGSPDYEWGIEGPQLVELPDGRILLNATCFLPSGKFGTRQRVFFALADSVEGPYRTLGPAIEPFEKWECGENGHAAAVIENQMLLLFYQARPCGAGGSQPGNWRYGIATFDPARLSVGSVLRKGVREFAISNNENPSRILE